MGSGEKQMSRRKNELEVYVAAKFEDTYKYARPTIASGATPVEKGDVKNPWFGVECKIRNTDSFSIKQPVWDKIRGESASEYKDALYVVQNKSGQRIAIMDLEEWFEMFNELIALRTEIKEHYDENRFVD
jgi:hypothetical protein